MKRFRRWRGAVAARLLLGMIACLLYGRSAAAQRDSAAIAQDRVTVRLVDVELRTAVQALAQYLDRPVVLGALPSIRVTLESPQPVARREVRRLLVALLETYNLELAPDSSETLYRVRPRGQAQGTDLRTGAQAAGVPSTGGQELFVIRLKHAKATEVAATVNALYGRASAIGEIGERPGTLAQELARNQAPPADAPPIPQAIPIGPVGRQAAFSGDVTIVPDPRANSLLVRSSRQDFALVQAAVTQLDVRPLQVLIEVLVAEIRKDRSFDIGVAWNLPTTKVQGTDNVKVFGNTTGLGLGDFALTVMGIGVNDLDATIRAAASRGDATILSRPILLAANNERAEINVGSQRPFVQVSRVLPTDNTARDQVVQYKDVGTRLSIVPTISGEGYVMLQVTQEINAATAEQQFNAPVISTRSVDTRLLIKDGQTIVLGGLTDRQKEVTKGGVPILSAIPLIGAIFGRQGRRSGETEMFVFLTPRLIRDDDDAEELTRPMRDRTRRVAP